MSNPSRRPEIAASHLKCEPRPSEAFLFVSSPPTVPSDRCKPTGRSTTTVSLSCCVHPMWSPPRTLLSLILATLLLLSTHLPVVEPQASKDRPRARCNKTVELYEEASTPAVTNDNKGLPMECWYKIRVKPSANDWIISVRFLRFKVGRLVNATTCAGGYVQIVDGRELSEQTNSATPGYFCGEIDWPRIFVSETSYVKIIFHVDEFSGDTHMTFDTRAEPHYQLYARAGPNPQLYPNRRGSLIPGTYCDRQFEECRLNTCYLQSPGYPGVYPRGVKCTYRIRTSMPYARLYTENELIDIDGQRCEDKILCPIRAPTNTECPYDYVQVYDGHSERSPLIGTFCGRGKFPWSITASGREISLVFVSSKSGPLLSTGFSFHVGPFSKWAGPGATLLKSSTYTFLRDNTSYSATRNSSTPSSVGTCDAVFQHEGRDETSPPLPGSPSSSALSATTLDTMRRQADPGDGAEAAYSNADQWRFHSLSTWYPPDTRCSFTIIGRKNEIVRLQFRTLRIGRQMHSIRDITGTRKPTSFTGSYSLQLSVPGSGEQQDVECAETLSIYDSPTRDDSKLLASFCDTWSQQPAANTYDGQRTGSKNEMVFVSSENAMFVQFLSLSGSYFGSSIDYWAQFDFYNAYHHGQAVPETVCDEHFSFSPEERRQPGYVFDTRESHHGVDNSASTGIFTAPLNNLVYLRKDQVTCKYRFDADFDPYIRVLLTFGQLNFAPGNQQLCISCVQDDVDKIIVVDQYEQLDEHTANVSACICGASYQRSQSITFLSSGPSLSVQLLVDSKFANYYFSKGSTLESSETSNAPIFHGQYEFLHGYLCGPAVLRIQNQGELIFPYQKYRYYDSLDEPNWYERTVRCVWTIQVGMRMDLYLRFEYLNIGMNCSNDRIEITIPGKQYEYRQGEPYSVICGNDKVPSHGLDLAVIRSSSLTSNRILLEYRTSSFGAKAAGDENEDRYPNERMPPAFKLIWTQLAQVDVHHSHKLTMNSADTLSSSASSRPVSECSFICAGSNACIPQELVCNGVRNCPLPHPSSSSLVPEGQWSPGRGTGAVSTPLDQAADEAAALCRQEESGIHWLAIGLGAVGGAVLAAIVMLLIHQCCRCCRRYPLPDTDPG